MNCWYIQILKDISCFFNYENGNTFYLFSIYTIIFLLLWSKYSLKNMTEYFKEIGEYNPSLKKYIITFLIFFITIVDKKDRLVGCGLLVVITIIAGLFLISLLSPIIIPFLVVLATFIIVVCSIMLILYIPYKYYLRQTNPEQVKDNKLTLYVNKLKELEIDTMEIKDIYKELENNYYSNL